MRKSEVAGIVKILESPQDYETPEAAAKAIVKWLDDDRAKRTGYVGILLFRNFAVGLGPYPGEKSAYNTVIAHPAASEADRVVIVPVTPPEGVERLLKEAG